MARGLKLSEVVQAQLYKPFRENENGLGLTFEFAVVTGHLSSSVRGAFGARGTNGGSSTYQMVNTFENKHDPECCDAVIRGTVFILSSLTQELELT